MEPEQLAKLPFLFQVASAFGIFFAALIIGLSGWLWKKVKPNLPDLLGTETTSKDVIIQSASIADSKSIANLAGAIEKLLHFLEEDAEDDNRASRRNHDVLCEIRDSLDALAKNIRSRTML